LTDPFSEVVKRRRKNEEEIRKGWLIGSVFRIEWNSSIGNLILLNPLPLLGFISLFPAQKLTKIKAQLIVDK